MPEALRILRDELPSIDVMISSQYSPLLADGLSKEKIDAAFLRRERGVPELAFRLLVKEPFMVVLPSDHHLAALKAISPGGSGRRDIRDRVRYGSCTAYGHRRLSEAVRNQYHASSRGRPSRNGNVLDSVDAGRRAVACLRTELPPFFCNESSSEGRYTNY
jgi:DNA-binding transcriptional LysR family regulator